MEAKTSPRAGKRVWLVVGLILAAALVGAGIYIGITAANKPDPVAVETSLRSYVENIAVAGKIVLVEARERLDISRTTPGLLFGDTAIGRFLDIRSDATIEASAWADLSFVVDLYATESWSTHYDPAEGGSLAVAAPPLSMLTPAIHTDTIEIRTTERSFFLDERKLEASALRDMTARFVEVASAMIEQDDVRTKAAASLESIVRAFAANGDIPIARVDVAFAPAED